MRSTISVAVVTYNGERYVSQQLSSILSQDSPPDEIVIGDDGSTDSTLEVIRKSLIGSRIPTRVITGDHKGLRRNVERTLSVCTGEVVVLADQDDVWMPQKLAAVRDAFVDPRVTLWFSDANFIDAEGNLLPGSLWDHVHLPQSLAENLSGEGGLRRLLHGMTITGATMAVRQRVLRSALPLPPELESPNHLMLHDGWIAVLAALLGDAVGDTARLTRYRQHAGQVTNQLRETASRQPRHSIRDSIREERARVDLVLNRLRSSGAIQECRPQDVQMLEHLSGFLAVRSSDPSPGKVAAIGRQWLSGTYSRFARGWRTAVADVVLAR